QSRAHELPQSETAMLVGELRFPEWVQAEIGVSIASDDADHCLGHDAAAHWAESARLDPLFAVRCIDGNVHFLRFRQHVRPQWALAGEDVAANLHNVADDVSSVAGELANLDLVILQRLDTNRPRDILSARQPHPPATDQITTRKIARRVA